MRVSNVKGKYLQNYLNKYRSKLNGRHFEFNVIERIDNWILLK